MSLLEARELSKRYGAVVAVRRGTLVVEPGEVHALLGANGAGKSTMVKILTGVVGADSGTISMEGSPVKIGSPARAVRHGMAPVFQDPSLVPDLTVRENLRLTRTSASGVRRWLKEMDFAVDFNETAGDLTLPAQRMLDLARALSHDPKLLILDEITAALPSDLAERVFAIMRRWRDEGRAVLFISHRLAEVTALCDRATVLRDGLDVGTMVPSEGGEAQIIEMMLGPEVAARAAEAAAISVDEAEAAVEAGSEAVAPGPTAEAEEATAAALAPPAGPPALEARSLRVGDQVHDVSLSVAKGEIVGIAALEGQGQDALFAALSGSRRPSRGEILVQGKPFKARTPYDAIRAGVVFVPADRVAALLPERSVRENLTTSLYNRPTRWGPINLGDERRRVRRAVEALQIDTRAQRQVRRLSGGNQQKVTIGRWLADDFDTMLCYDPTRGIDVGTKRQIYALLRELANAGSSVLVFTSELAEVPLICDRALVLWNGRVSAELPAAACDEATLLNAMHGLVEEVPA